MRRLILTALVAILCVSAADAGPIRQFLAHRREVRQGQPATPVRTAVATTLTATGGAIQAAGGVVHSTTYRGDWTQPAPDCPNGTCPRIPPQNLPVR